MCRLPNPERVAWRVSAPMVSAIWGVPVAVTILSKSTSTLTVSPSPYVSPVAGEDLKEISRTLGGDATRLPFTLLSRWADSAS